jgi:hypothetical protein
LARASEGGYFGGHETGGAPALVYLKNERKHGGTTLSHLLTSAVWSFLCRFEEEGGCLPGTPRHASGESFFSLHGQCAGFFASSTPFRTV